MKTPDTSSLTQALSALAIGFPVRVMQFQNRGRVIGDVDLF